MPIILIVAVVAIAAYAIYNNTAQADTGSSSSDGGDNVQNDGSGSALADTRGFRNNNPGNLVYILLNPFNGQIGKDGAYAVYDTISNGVRALGKQLDNYVVRDNLTTVQDIITKWAPPSENDTQAYIVDVANRLGVAVDQPLAWPSEKPDLVAAIIQHENGVQPLATDDIITYINS
jgi:hypothetical protein